MSIICVVVVVLSMQVGVGDSRLIGGVGLGATETCEPTYGFLPCSSNAWGLLFLVIVFEILITLGSQYVGDGSDLFFQTIGPGILGASVFQFLGTIPQIVMVLCQFLLFLPLPFYRLMSYQFFFHFYI